MVFGLLGRIARDHPFKFGCAFSCAKTSFSDWLVQSYIEKREEIDWKRNATFATFGLVYLGGVQYALYVPVFGRMFPNAAAYAAKPLRAKLADAAGSRNMLTQVVLDQFVHHPLMYFPAFYSLKEVVSGGDVVSGVTNGLQKYSKNYQEDLMALWKLWVPSTIINFAFMPMHMRIPWVASTSLFWTCILSYMRGNDDSVVTTPDEAMNVLGGSAGKALKELYDLGTSAKPAYLYDQSKEYLLVTTNGRDRIGFIKELASIVAGEGGNVVDCKAYKVGREGVLIMIIEADPAHVKNMSQGITQLAKQGANPIQVNVARTQPWMTSSDSPRCKDGVSFTGHLTATGPDKPGMLLALTSFLADQHLDVMSFSCNQHMVRVEGTEGTEQPRDMFQMSGVVRAFQPIDRKALAVSMQEFTHNHGCRFTILETEDDPSYTSFRSTLERRR